MASLFHVLNISKQDLMSRLIDMSSVSNNLANINTIGFKASRTNFQEFLEHYEKHGVKVGTTQVLMGQGMFKESDKPLDIAIDGAGFFAVRLPDGRTGYTRDGQFSLDAQRNIVHANGSRLIWSGQIPENFEEVRVENNGTISYRVGDVWSTAGVIPLTRFPNPGGLNHLGNNIWVESPASGAAQTGNPQTNNLGIIRPRVLEMSNVNAGDELTHLMTLQRIFTLSLRSFQQTDQMISQSINMRKG